MLNQKSISLKTKAHNKVERALEHKIHLKVHQRQQVNIKHFLKNQATMEDANVNIRDVKNYLRDGNMDYR